MGMAQYISARIVYAVVVSMIIVTASFLLLYFSPNPNIQAAAQQAALGGENPEEAVERVKEARGLNDPIHVQYMQFVENVYTLDWGWSETRSEPVTDAIVSSFKYTAQYSVPWTVLSVLIAPTLGIYSASRMYTWKDHLATGFAFFGYAIPNFFFAILLVLVFGVWFEIFPITYDTTVPILSLENAWQLVLPVFVLVTGSIGGTMRVARNESAEFMNADFMKTAKAKGVKPTRRYTHHVLRPTLVPLSTSLVSALFALFVGASVLVEEVFAIPGLGRLLVQSIISQDTSLVLGTTLVFTFVGVVGNLVEDLVFTMIDPRISYDDR
ncbi:ABC transporter permease [Halovenus rubra]|uniref:ABC transporter permease n=2 Tax=Halovenus rubra TaxID=869890 RepID=A0ABD5X2N6_9EURY|nr:ABC transporter permease [Halovenus rubra]